MTLVRDSYGEGLRGTHGREATAEATTGTVESRCPGAQKARLTEEQQAGGPVARRLPGKAVCCHRWKPEGPHVAVLHLN